jgi:hypothetical protein
MVFHYFPSVSARVDFQARPATRLLSACCGTPRAEWLLYFVTAVFRKPQHLEILSNRSEFFHCDDLAYFQYGAGAFVCCVLNTLSCWTLEQPTPDRFPAEFPANGSRDFLVADCGPRGCSCRISKVIVGSTYDCFVAVYSLHGQRLV